MDEPLVLVGGRGPADDELGEPGRRVPVDQEADGLVHREAYHQVPPKVEYSLTDYGRTLEVALRPLGDWGHANMARIEATHP
ncbi:hypothetical protein DY240_27820 [Jiangella rhizosphaerae]|uniref:HTH hxlR-type domain-containing protein n=1 Tax=Jiangella rhizosphaerae TaxID=2293569 RepID=A0A418KHP3_9ACTN|nr:hypothetical protein DY240_27820 [Jiangella rhizosphaerae]